MVENSFVCLVDAFRQPQLIESDHIPGRPRQRWNQIISRVSTGQPFDQDIGHMDDGRLQHGFLREGRVMVEEDRLAERDRQMPSVRQAAPDIRMREAREFLLHFEE